MHIAVKVFVIHLYTILDQYRSVPLGYVEERRASRTVSALPQTLNNFLEGFPLAPEGVLRLDRLALRVVMSRYQPPSAPLTK